MLMLWMLVLLAEDEQDIARLYRATLEKRGHHVTMALDGEECMRLYNFAHRQKNSSNASKEETSLHDNNVIKKPPFDAVILDHRMPRKTGLQVANEILMLEPEQRIIFVSAYAKESLAKPIGEFNAEVELYQKPIGLDKLVDAIEDKMLYAELKKLGADVNRIAEMNPTHKQLKQLVEGLQRILNS